MSFFLGLQPFNGVKFDEELPRIRGGPILWILIGNMQNKLACIHPEMKKQLALKEKKSPLGSPICHWMDGKKYFAYSAVIKNSKAKMIKRFLAEINTKKLLTNNFFIFGIFLEFPNKFMVKKKFENLTKKNFGILN